MPSKKKSEMTKQEIEDSNVFHANFLKKTIAQQSKPKFSILIVSGPTFVIRKQLKALGFMYNPIKKNWFITISQLEQVDVVYELVRDLSSKVNIELVQ